MSQVPVFFCGVEDGQIRMVASERERMKQYLSTWSGDGELVVRRRKSKRSVDQNAYVWSVPYPLLAKALGYDQHEIEDLHYALVAKWGGEHFDKRVGAMVPNKRSSQLTTKEFSDYIEWLIRFGAQSCDCVIPLPGESEAA